MIVGRRKQERVKEYLFIYGLFILTVVVVEGFMYMYIYLF